MKYSDALGIAQVLVDDLSPVCVRIQIAGSLRRGVEEVKDVEILAIPGPSIVIKELDMFGEVVKETHKCPVEERIRELIGFDMWPWMADAAIRRWGPKYKRLRHEGGICCDLFLTDRRRWGYQLAIRTGPAKFSQALVTLALRRNWHCTDSLLHQHPKVKDEVCPKGADCPLIISTTNEIDFLGALGLPWIEPADRKEDIVWEKAKEDVFR